MGGLIVDRGGKFSVMFHFGSFIFAKHQNLTLFRSSNHPIFYVVVTSVS